MITLLFELIWSIISFLKLLINNSLFSEPSNPATCKKSALINNVPVIVSFVEVYFNSDSSLSSGCLQHSSFVFPTTFHYLIRLLMEKGN